MKILRSSPKLSDVTVVSNCRCKVGCLRELLGVGFAVLVGSLVGSGTCLSAPDRSTFVGGFLHGS